MRRFPCLASRFTCFWYQTVLECSELGRERLFPSSSKCQKSQSSSLAFVLRRLFLESVLSFLLFLSSLSSPFEWTLILDTSCISICRKLNQSSWPLLVRFACFFFPSSFFSATLRSPLIWWGGKKSIFRSSKMQTTNCFYSNPGSTGWECLTWDERLQCVERDLTFPGSQVLQSLTSFANSEYFHTFTWTRLRWLACSAVRRTFYVEFKSDANHSFHPSVSSSFFLTWSCCTIHGYPRLSHNPGSFFWLELLYKVKKRTPLFISTLCKH